MHLRGFLALAVALALAACGQAKPSLEWRDGEFRAHGWSGPEPADGWVSVFYVGDGRSGDPPMLGTFRRRGETVTFTPRFRPQGKVVATFRPPAPAAAQRLELTIGTVRDAPRVTAISPAADIVPANLLKLYVEFDRPMARGEAYSHLQILDDQGRVVADPFVEIDQELWDPAGRRLTVLFDPGRIKRGVRPNRDIGAPFEVGRIYRLVVGQGWASAAGGALATNAVKAFTVAPAERRPIVLAEWKIASPRAGTRDPLVIEFPRPLDGALLADCLHVTQGGDGVVGAVAIADQARRWTFTPAEPWRAGPYDLQVETRLEDLAGNRIGRSFDVDTVASPQARIDKASETLRFSVR